jgi:flagella basal body P-ring formation protein FlgA
MLDVLRVLPIFLIAAVSAAANELPGEVALTSAFAEKLVREELRFAGEADGFEVTVDRPRLPLGNQEARPTKIVLDGLRHDPASGRFSAVMIGTVGDQPRFQLPLEGRIQPLINVAVLARSIRRGERIGAADLDFAMVPPDSLPTGSLVEEAELIGAEARRRLAPGRVLTNRDVGPPRLVLRGQPVRVTYAEGGLKLTALGLARDDAAFGEPVRVFNSESRLELQGVAIGPQEVTVGPAAMPGAGY